jgi:hypothetical protein
VIRVDAGRPWVAYKQGLSRGTVSAGLLRGPQSGFEWLRPKSFIKIALSAGTMPPWTAGADRQQRDLRRRSAEKRLRDNQRNGPAWVDAPAARCARRPGVKQRKGLFMAGRSLFIEKGGGCGPKENRLSARACRNFSNNY